ncbi:HNH endonuclease [Streptomyces sp. NPDC056508]|uniref:HNH endonuclease n=1 Tax=Streptomyces sp. NPDC056508 TaxID=3345845 RepID=UPI0036908AEC
MRRAGVVRTVAEIIPRTVRVTARPLRPIRPPRRTETPEVLSRAAVLRRWEELEWWSCAYCDRSFGPTVVAEIDHIRPASKGGSDEWVNLAPACQECNRAKSDLDVGAWLADFAGQREAEGAPSVTGSYR